MLIDSFIYPSVAGIVQVMGKTGSFTIANNQLTPSSIPAFFLDGNIHSSMQVDYEIIRYTGDEYRSSVGQLYLVCKGNGVWYTERGLQIIDIDGVTFSIQTIADRVGQLQYVSDNMLGGGYTGSFKYRTINFGV